jgi:hypothetical protein
MATLTEHEVRERLEVSESTDVIDIMYDMGKTLMSECGERIDYLDAKAARIAGYAGAMVGLMVSTFPIWTSAISRWAVILAAVGMLAGTVAAISVIHSMWPAKLRLPSDSDWLESDALDDANRLKKYYISSIHLLVSSQEPVAVCKVSAIKRSQCCLALMALAMLIVFANATYRVTRSSQQSSDHAASAVSAAHP